MSPLVIAGIFCIGVVVGSVIYQAGYWMGKRAGSIDARLETADVFDRYIAGKSPAILRNPETGEIIDGHQRERACLDLGITPAYEDVELPQEGAPDERS